MDWYKIPEEYRLSIFRDVRLIVHSNLNAINVKAKAAAEAKRKK